MLWLIFLKSKNRYPVFCPFLRIFRSEFLIQDLTSRLKVIKNGISMYQNLNGGVDNKK